MRQHHFWWEILLEASDRRAGNQSAGFSIFQPPPTATTSTATINLITFCPFAFHSSFCRFGFTFRSRERAHAAIQSPPFARDSRVPETMSETHVHTKIIENPWNTASFYLLNWNFHSYIACGQSSDQWDFCACECVQFGLVTLLRLPLHNISRRVSLSAHRLPVCLNKCVTQILRSSHPDCRAHTHTYTLDGNQGLKNNNNNKKKKSHTQSFTQFYPLHTRQPRWASEENVILIINIIIVINIAIITFISVSVFISFHLNREFTHTHTPTAIALSAHQFVQWALRQSISLDSVRCFLALCTEYFRLFSSGLAVVFTLLLHSTAADNPFYEAALMIRRKKHGLKE